MSRNRKVRLSNAEYRKIAAADQAKNQDKDGITLIEDGVAVGWRDELRDPHTVEDGTIAVGVKDGRVWEMVGGERHTRRYIWQARPLGSTAQWVEILDDESGETTDR